MSSARSEPLAEMAYCAPLILAKREDFVLSLTGNMPDSASESSVASPATLDLNSSSPTTNINVLKSAENQPLVTAPQCQGSLPQREELPYDKQADAEVFNNDEERLLRNWTLRSNGPLGSIILPVLPFVSPQSTAATGKKSRQSAVSEIRVEIGLLPSVPDELRLTASRVPCAVFTVRNLETEKPRWLFVKEYEQLANFDALIQNLLAPMVRMTSFRLREFPSRDLFLSRIPWKVDLRNDMLNAYFKSLFWLYDTDYYRKHQSLRHSIERALNALWMYDKVEPSPVQRAGPLGEDIGGFLMSMASHGVGQWTCYYYALNGAFLDVIDDISTGHVRESFNLHNAEVRKLLLEMYLAKPDNERYAINLYEVNARGERRLHTLCAENENARQKWLYHLRLRVTLLNELGVPRGFRNARKGFPLPYALLEPFEESPYLPVAASRFVTDPDGMLDHLPELPETSLAPVLYNAETFSAKDTWSLTSKGRKHGDRRSSSTASTHSKSSSGPKSVGSKTFGLKTSKSVSGSGKISVSEISGPVATLESSRDSVIAHAIASETQELLWQAPSTSPRQRVVALGEVYSSRASPSRANEGSSPDRSLRRRGPRVFGIMPEECRYLVELYNGDAVPSVVARCLETLWRLRASDEMGLFRISGSQKRLDELEALFDRHGDYDMEKGGDNVHTTADLLKRYLRELPDRLLAEYPESRIQPILALNVVEQAHVLRNDMKDVSPVNYAVVRAILQLLHHVSTKEATNAMGIRNLAVAMSPSLRVPVPILEIYMKQYGAVFEQQ